MFIGQTFIANKRRYTNDKKVILLWEKNKHKLTDALGKKKRDSLFGILFKL